MKPFITLFLFLLCALFSRFGYAHTSGHKIMLCFSSNCRIEKKQQPVRVIENVTPVIKTAAISEAIDDLICVEEEEDDKDDINKRVTASCYFIAFYYSFLLIDKDCIFSNRLPVYTHLCYLGSCKYIAQRVLRI